MTAQHTPGPWLIAGEDKTFVYALGPRHTNSFWAHVQTAGQERVSNDECKANARLIAAAPELLVELKHCKALAKKDSEDGFGVFDAADVARIDALIAKATSQQGGAS